MIIFIFYTFHRWYVRWIKHMPHGIIYSTSSTKKDSQKNHKKKDAEWQDNVKIKIAY